MALAQLWLTSSATHIRDPAFSDKIESKAYDLAKEIFETLEKKFPVISRQRQSLERLYEKVVRPSFKLAINLQGSSTSYKFAPDMIGPSTYSFNHIPARLLGKSTLIDVSTRKTLKRDRPVVADTHGCIRKPLLLVEPGLFRLNGAEEDATELRQPTICTYLLQL